MATLCWLNTATASLWTFKKVVRVGRNGDKESLVYIESIKLRVLIALYDLFLENKLTQSKQLKTLFFKALHGLIDRTFNL